MLRCLSQFLKPLALLWKNLNVLVRNNQKNDYKVQHYNMKLNMYTYIIITQNKIKHNNFFNMLKIHLILVLTNGFHIS